MTTRRKSKRISKSYRTFLFKQRMTNIIWLLVGVRGTHCYFCGEPFKPSDFPIDGPDRIHIHHITYIPEVKVLAHKKCHKKYHADLRKAKSNLITK